MEAPEETPEGTIWERVAKDKSARLRGEGPFARARGSSGGVRQRVGKVGQRIKQIIRPLEVLQFVAALFLNVTLWRRLALSGIPFRCRSTRGSWPSRSSDGWSRSRA